MFNEKITDAVKNLPRKPGVYIMYNVDGVIIYIGKAKNLKNRVSQYFRAQPDEQIKVRMMVRQIDRFEYIVTDTELEALILECNLIKKHLPHYNILLKDDKGYPYIKVTNEPFPRVVLARRPEADGARYFGPYLSTAVVHETIDVIKKVFTVRSCNRNLPRDAGKGRACLNYAIKQCSAPCENHITQEEYNENIKNACAFLEGRHEGILASLEEEMQEASGRLEFERAAKLRDKIRRVRQISDKQKMVSVNAGNQDIIAMAQNGADACVQIFFVRGGRVSGRDSFMLKTEDSSDILGDFLKQYYSISTYVPATIVVRREVEDMALIEEWLRQKSGARINLVAPKRGEKLSIVKMVEENAVESLRNYQSRFDIKKRKLSGILFELKELLGIDEAPARIEAYDISNTSGQDNVGVYVVYENAEPKKSEYRKFNVRSVEGEGDDYESMREVLYRRLSNGVEGEKGFIPLPDLIFVDGGLGHVNAARGILEHFSLEIPLFGIVKDDRHRTRGLVSASGEVAVKRDSKTFHFLTRVQDEMHRYAITTHQKRRGKHMKESELTGIPGVGEVRRKALLTRFGGVRGVLDASLEELMEVVDRRTAESVIKWGAEAKGVGE